MLRIINLSVSCPRFKFYHSSVMGVSLFYSIANCILGINCKNDNTQSLINNKIKNKRVKKKDYINPTQKQKACKTHFISRQAKKEAQYLKITSKASKMKRKYNFSNYFSSESIELPHPLCCIYNISSNHISPFSRIPFKQF